MTWEAGMHGAVLRALANPPMWPRFDSDLVPCGVEIIVGTRHAVGSPRSTSVCLPPEKTTFPNSNSTWIENPRETQLRVTSPLNTVTYFIFQYF